MLITCPSGVLEGAAGFTLGAVVFSEWMTCSSLALGASTKIFFATFESEDLIAIFTILVITGSVFTIFFSCKVSAMPTARGLLFKVVLALVPVGALGFAGTLALAGRFAPVFAVVVALSRLETDLVPDAEAGELKAGRGPATAPAAAMPAVTLAAPGPLWVGLKPAWKFAPTTAWTLPAA